MRTHIRRIVAAGTGALVLAGCSSGPESNGARTPPPLPGATGSSPTTTTAGSASPGSPRNLVTGLSVPWAIAFLPGGDALVTERDSARLLRVTPQGRVGVVGRISGVQPQGEGGLMGVAVSPSYDRDRQIFVYYTAALDNRVVRYRYDGSLSQPRAIVTGIPKGGVHNGGRIAFGPDGLLYIATGETGATDLAQDRGSPGGKILRVTADGEPASGNPFSSRVWSYGHRNVQGLAWDERRRMFATEFGQNTYDEINRIERGRNYGWPEVEGVQTGQPDDRYTDPLLTWTTAEASPSGLAYASGSLWAAGLRGERLWQVPVGADGQVGRPTAHYDGEYGRLRAVVRAPDGNLWLTTSNKDGRGEPGEDDDRILVVPLG